MAGKQILTDIIVVVMFPLLLIGGYFSFKSEDGALLSLAAPAVATTPGAEGQKLGEKTATALVLLRSIPQELNQSLFTDPAYLMLKDYRVTIPTIPLGRANPFTPPPELENLSRFSKSSDTTPVQGIPASAMKAGVSKKDTTN